jgi:hypothetical protein
MILIPKAFVTIENTLVINPTEESLIIYFSEEGLDSIEAILEFYDNDWNEILRRWFVGAYYTPELIKQHLNKGIFRFDTENNEENIEVINEVEFDNLKKDGLIY